MSQERSHQAAGAEGYRLDRRRYRAAFDAAAGRYDTAAVLQRAVVERLDERLGLFRLEPGRVLDAGAGTGYGSRLLGARYPRANVVALDLAYGMVAQARRQRRRKLWTREGFVCGDVQTPPFAPGSFDVVFCSLVLQWCSELDAVLQALAGLLRPAGLLIFATLGPDTLRELRAAWAEVDDALHVHAFMDMHDVGDALIRAGLASPVMDVETLTLTYPRLQGLLGDLKTLGATNAARGRQRGLTTRARLARLEQAYERFRADGLLPASYEVVYGHAFAPEPGGRPQDGSTVAKFPLSELRRRR